MSHLQTGRHVQEEVAEQAATIRYVERWFLSAQMSKYSALLFTLVAVMMVPLLEHVWFGLAGLIWLGVAYYRQREAQEKLVELERTYLTMQQQLVTHEQTESQEENNESTNFST